MAHTTLACLLVLSLANVPRFFVDPTATSILPENRDLRPLLMVSFALNHAVSGGHTWSYHLVNLLLHWLACLLVYRIVRDHLWLGDEAVPIAVAAALIVAVHPLNTEPVNYLSARSALLTAVFYLAAFDSAVRHRLTASLVFFAAALLTKAIAVTLPAMLLAYFWLSRSTSSPRRAPSWWFWLALLALDGGQQARHRAEVEAAAPGLGCKALGREEGAQPRRGDVVGEETRQHNDLLAMPTRSALRERRRRDRDPRHVRHLPRPACQRDRRAARREDGKLLRRAHTKLQASCSVPADYFVSRISRT